VDLAQIYETTVYNRDTGRAFGFATAPARSFPERETPTMDRLVELGDLPDAIRIRPVEAWNLPFLLDAALGRFPDFPYEFHFYFDPLESARPRRTPSPFAQHLAYAPIIPFEASPLGGKSLAEVLTTAGTGTGAVVGAYAMQEPLVLVAVPAGIIVCKAASHVGDGIGIALRTLILRLVGAEVEDTTEPPNEDSTS